MGEQATSESLSVKRATLNASFVHLHNHSHYSLLDGLQKVPQMLDRVAELGMNAVALTDHGTLSGAIEFYKAAKKRHINPIIGLETYMAPRSHTDKTAKLDANPYHLILLAENNQGYQNLMRLASIAHIEGFYYKPRIDRELLAQYKDGLIILSGCIGGEVGTHLRNGQMEQAEAVVRWYQETVGPDNYFLELQDHQHQWEVQRQVNNGLLELSQRTGARMVVTADSHYTLPTDKEAHEILLCVQTGKTIGDSDRMTMDMDLFVSDPADIAKRWEKHPELLSNTVKIAERCKVELKLGNILIPRFDVPSQQSERDYLHQLCWQGLMWRYGNIAKEDLNLMTEVKARATLDEATIARADYELSVIGQMKYEGYFLIVADFINWGKNRGIIFGPGRGSAAGSIIAYALNITDLDPLAYGLMFERFLNPDRISMPDIDIDIQDSRREEVITYVTEKYGQSRVAQIITFGTMAARNAVRDTGRVLGMTYAEVDAIAKLIPQPIQGRHIPLAKSIKDDPDLKREYQSNSRAKRLIDQAIKLEGTIRSNGVHAAGVVIAPDDVVNYTPLQRAQKGGITTQYEMNAIQDDLGLLKMDFLGLSNLTIINNALRIIKKVYGQTIDITELPLDDADTFALLSRGDTTGVFQLESPGMKRYLRELKPTQFEDIIAMVALYRPGPMAEIPRYIEGKHHPDAVTYPHPSLQPILKPTYGVMVYQDQITALLQLIAGYSAGQADLVRKAIGKKKRDIMAAEEPKFIEGCIKQGLSKEGAASLWVLIQPFADYSFNKAHSACYGLIAYQTAYLKAHFPAAFMAALMTSDHDNIDRIAIEVAECQRMGMPILPPSVNESFLEFSINKDAGTIRFGLAAVKNVGSGAIAAILNARAEGGSFSGVEDFAKRVSASDFNKKAWESLIKSGGMDLFGDRGQLLASLDTMVSYASKAQKSALSGQIDIFGSMATTDDLPALRLDPVAQPASKREQLAWEKELLGLYLSHHPLDDYDNFLRTLATPIADLRGDIEGKAVKIGGIITAARKITTKNGDAMAFVRLEDKSGDIELVVFPKAYDQNAELWQADQVLMVEGKISTKGRDGRLGDEIKLMVDKARIIDHTTASTCPPPPEAPAPSEPTVVEPIITALLIHLPDTSDSTLLLRIKDLLGSYSGQTEAFIVLGTDEQRKIRLPLKINPSPELQASLRELIGANAISVTK